MAGDLTLPVGARDHAQGANDALITLVEYGDYQCPYCGRAYPIVKAIQRRFGHRLRFVFRNFPLREVHAHAELAAEAAEAADAQGKFWAMHDLLFENQADLAGQFLVRYAERLELDLDRWTQDVNARAFSGRVGQDLSSGLASGVRGTPTFFINGYRHEGPFDIDSLTLAIEAGAQPLASGR